MTCNKLPPLYVSAPLLPDLEDFNSVISEIWKSGHVTNHGPFSLKLEEQLRLHLDVPTAMAFNNGTSALLVALKMFDLPPGSEVITTPMTFAATAHVITWNGLKVVFADVLEDDLTIDPASVEKAITPDTRAILAVHVYGSICDVEALNEIASRHNLKLIYDAAHAFGATVHGRSVASYGDASVFSFHATKLFNTIEGGLITTSRAEDAGLIYLLRNFGIKNEEEVVSVGINGKINELQAAVGLLNLPLVEGEKSKRSKLRSKYSHFLRDLPGIRIQSMKPGINISEQYYPIIIDPTVFGRSRDDIYNQLMNYQIYSRKYFHPICTDFVPYKKCKIVSTRSNPYVEQVKSQVLCLPFHSGVTDEHLAIMKDVFTKTG